MIQLTKFSQPYGKSPTWEYVCDTREEAQGDMPEDAPVGSVVQVGEDGSVWRKFPTAGWKELPKNTPETPGTEAALVCGGRYLQA